MFGSFNNWNIIQFSHKATSSEDIEKIVKFLLDRISDNLYALVQTGKYGDINTTNLTTVGYYVIRFMSKYYTIKEAIMCNRKISSAGELVFKDQYISCMEDNTKWYWRISQQQNNIIVPTCTIFHPCLGVMTVAEVKTNTKICMQ